MSERAATDLEPAEWIAARRPSAFTVGLGKDKYRPDLLVLVHVPTGIALLAEPIEPDVTLEEIADRVAAFVEQPGMVSATEKAAPPTALRVETPDLAEALRERVEASLPVTVGEVPEIEPLLEGLARVAKSLAPETKVLPFRMGRAEDATVEAFFAAANRVFVRGPWQTAHESQVFGLEAPAFGWPAGAAVSIIGSAGEHPGVLVFPSLDQSVRFLEQAAEADRTGETPLADSAVFSVNFDAKREVPKDRVKRAKALALRPADPQGFPWVQRFAPRNVPLDLSDDDYAFAAALLDALASLLDADQGLFERETMETSVEAEGAFATAESRRTVRLVAPHPAMTWGWSEDAIEAFRWSTADEVLEEYQPGPALDAVEGFLAFKIFARNEEPFDLAHDDVEEYLLRYLPAEGAVPDDEVALLPDRLAHFLRWLGERGHIAADLAGVLAADTDRVRADYLARIHDPSLFSDAKTLALEIRKAGVDVDDQEAVARFMEEYEARLPDDEPSSKKWTWQPGEPVPDPKGDCPCGSGKRYRKCCMPR